MDNEEFSKLDRIRDQLGSISTRKAGRPRKFKAEYIDAQAQKLMDWLDKKDINELFWLKEFCLESGLSYDQIRTFGELSYLYKKALDRLHAMQEVALCKYCARSKTNFIFGMFALKSICGWKDGREVKAPEKARTYTDNVKDEPDHG